MHLHCFSACSSWPTVWILTMVTTRPTLTNPFWAAATLSMFTLQLRIRRRNANTCHRHPRWPYCRQEALRPVFCARLTIKWTSSLTLPFPARFWPSGDLLSHTILARSFLRETTVLLFFGWLQHGLTFGRPSSQPFSLSIYFCYVSTVVYRYSLLWDRIVFCFYVVSVSMWYLLLHVFIW